MSERVPDFDDIKVAEIFRDLYRLEGTITPLVSYEDQNVRIKTPTASFVLKIANTKWSLEFLRMQTDVLGFLQTNAPKLKFPSVVATVNGQNIATVDGFSVRLLTYLEGDLFTNTQRTPALYHDVGRFMGAFTRAMQSFALPIADGSDKLWKLDNVLACRPYLPDVIDEETRDRIDRIYVAYERNTLPKVAHLRKSVIHGDANEQNFLVDPKQPEKISGLIDFGEMQMSSLVNDLAIALAYGLLDEDDIGVASSKMIEGYESEFELENVEREILHELMAMRLVASITLSSRAAKEHADNEYIVIAQKPAQVLLRKLEEQKYILA